VEGGREKWKEGEEREGETEGGREEGRRRRGKWERWRCELNPQQNIALPGPL